MSDKAGVTPTQAGQQSKLNSVEGRVLGSSNTLSKIASQPSPSSKAPQKPKDLTLLPLEWHGRMHILVCLIGANAFLLRSI